MKWLVLLAGYLLSLLLFWLTCDHLTPEQAAAAVLLQAVLTLTAICALQHPIRGQP